MKEALCGASALERGHHPPWSPSPSGPQQLPLYSLPWPFKGSSPGSRRHPPIFFTLKQSFTGRGWDDLVENLISSP